MIEHRWDDGTVVKYDLATYILWTFGDREEHRDDVAECRARIAFLMSSGTPERQAFDAAVLGMTADRDAAEKGVRSIRTWRLWTLLREHHGWVRRPDGRDDPRLVVWARVAHDEAIARQCGIVSPTRDPKLETIVKWYAGIVEEEFREDLYQNEPYPLSVSHESWDQVPEHLRWEMCERAGFLILRGNKPESALKLAMAQVEAETTEWTAASSCPVWYNIVRKSASLHPLPRRKPSGVYVAWIVRMAQKIHANAMARMTADPAFEEEDHELHHSAVDPADVERLTRLYCDRIRIAIHLETLDEASEDAL